MHRANRILGAVVLVLGLVWTYLSMGLDMERAGAPGPGFVPMASALAMALMGAGLVVSNLRGSGPKVAWADRDGLGRVLTISAAFIGYIFASGVIGFFASTTLFMLCAIRYWGGYRWRTTVTLAVVLSTAGWAVFQLWLGLPLPYGLIFEVG